MNVKCIPSCFWVSQVKEAIFKLINVKDHGIQKTRTTPAGNGKQLQILTFLDGRDSVCKLVCAIGDCLDTPGRLEDLPGVFLVFGELTENLTKRRNDQLLKKVRSLATVTCGCAYRTTGGSIVCGRKVTMYSARARC